MQTRMSCRCNGRLPDRGAGASGRTDQAGMGEGCSGDGGRSGTYASGSDRGKYESAAVHLSGSAVLCIGTTCDRYWLRDMTILLLRLAERGSIGRSGIFVLCDTGRASGSSESGRCKTGNHGRLRLRHMRQILQKECGEQDRQMTGWHKPEEIWTGKHSGSVPWIRRRQNGSGMRESLNMRILVPCAESSVRCAA